MNNSKTLLTTSIILIVIAVFGIITSLLFLFASTLFSGNTLSGVLYNYISEEVNNVFNSVCGIARVVMRVMRIIGIIYSGFQLFIGIIGVKNRENPRGARVCFVFGIILIITSVFQFIPTLIGMVLFDLFSQISIASNVLVLVLAVLYTVSSYKISKINR